MVKLQFYGLLLILAFWNSSNLRAGAPCLQVGEESPLFFC